MKRVHRAMGITLLAGAWLGISALDTPARLPRASAQDGARPVNQGLAPTEAPAIQASRGDESRSDVGATLRVVSEWRVGVYLVRVQTDGIDQVLTLARSGRVVHQQRGHSFELTSVREGERFSSLAPGRDLTGDGQPDLAISERTGGSHCSNTVWVFELGETVRRARPIPAAHEGVAYFEDVDGDGCLEFRTHDWTFANWRTAFAFSPAPEVVLTLSEGGIRPKWSLMPAPQRTVEEQAAELEADSDWAQGEVPPTLWGYMLDWIYGGRPEAAWRLLTRAWPVETPGRDAFERAFRAQLAQSPYWRELAPRLK